MILSMLKNQIEFNLIQMIVIFFCLLPSKMASCQSRTKLLFSEISNLASKGINIRLAKREDIPRINECNIQNLPENYSHYFYLNHLSKWCIIEVIDNFPFLINT
jgi:hypothetical protein